MFLTEINVFLLNEASCLFDIKETLITIVVTYVYAVVKIIINYI